MDNQIELPRFEGLPALSELEILDEEHSSMLDFNESFRVGSVATSRLNAVHAFRVAIDLRDLTKIARFQETSDSLLLAIIVKVKGEQHKYSLIVIETSGPDRQLVAKLDGVKAAVIGKTSLCLPSDSARKITPHT